MLKLRVPCRGGASSGADLRWSKWSYWTFHALVFLLLYTGILVLPHTQQRVRVLCRTSSIYALKPYASVLDAN